MTSSKFKVEEKWTLEGNFFRFVLHNRFGTKMGKELAEDTGLTMTAITHASKGSGPKSLGEMARKLSRSFAPDGLNVFDEERFIESFQSSVDYFTTLAATKGVPLKTPEKKEAVEFLIDTGLVNEDFSPSEQLLRLIEKRLDREDEVGRHATSSSTARGERGISTDEQKESPNLGTSHQPENHVEKICYMRPIEVRQGEDDGLEIFLDINLGEENKIFDDLVVAAGFEKLRIKVNLEGFQDVRSHHRDGNLRGRIAIQNGEEVFVVEETYFGKPAPFLKDTVFEGQALHSAKLSEPKGVPKISVTCFIAFSDFELDVFDVDGDRISDFTERQQNLRKLALKEFIKTRCKTRGFEGTVSEAEWVDDAEA